VISGERDICRMRCIGHNLLRAASGSGGSLARFAIGVDYLAGYRGMSRTPEGDKRVHVVGERQTAADPLVFLQGGYTMAYAARPGTVFVAGMLLAAGLATAARAQSPQYPKPTESKAGRPYPRA
jgi:hypothetical protein